LRVLDPLTSMSPWNGITPNGEFDVPVVMMLNCQVPAESSTTIAFAPGAPLAVPALVT